MQITYNQNLLDAALLQTGTLQSLFHVARAAGLSVSDIPDIGIQVLAPTGAPTYKKDLQYFTDNKINRGTTDDGEINQGIGYWKIEINFKVS